MEPIGFIEGSLNSTEPTIGMPGPEGAGSVRCRNCILFESKQGLEAILSKQLKNTFESNELLFQRFEIRLQRAENINLQFAARSAGFCLTVLYAASKSKPQIQHQRTKTTIAPPPYDCAVKGTCPWRQARRAVDQCLMSS